MRYSFIILLFLIIPLLLSAQSDSFMVVRKDELPTALVKRLEMQEKLESAGKMAGVGREIGVAIREGLGALTDESNRFADTKVGVFVMWMIAFKVMGYPAIQAVVGIPLIIIGTIIFIIFFFKACVPRKVLNKTTGTGKDIVKEYKVWEPDEPWYPLSAAAIYAAYLALCCSIIFIH